MFTIIAGIVFALFLVGVCASCLGRGKARQIFPQLMLVVTVLIPLLRH